MGESKLQDCQLGVASHCLRYIQSIFELVADVIIIEVAEVDTLIDDILV
jgi:hypothetical protein